MFKKTSEGKGVNIKIRRQIERGILPVGVSFDNIVAALADTKKPNTFEMFGFLSRIHTRGGKVIANGLVSCRLVTTAFAAYLVDSLQNSTTTPMDLFKYHAVGTGTTAEANTQTALVTEIMSRVVGTQIEGASVNIYKSVATVVFDNTYSVSEHGFFTAATVGTMMDRSLLTPADDVQNLDEIEYTYQLTVSAET